MAIEIKGPWLKIFFYRIAIDEDKSIAAYILKPILLLCSLVYAQALRITAFFYQKDFLKRYRLSKKVISIGNITMGAAGKTPLVEEMVAFLKTKQLKPAILIRGYMNQVKVNQPIISDEA